LLKKVADSEDHARFNWIVLELNCMTVLENKKPPEGGFLSTKRRLIKN
jgi:hypothetical protein